MNRMEEIDKERAEKLSTLLIEAFGDRRGSIKQASCALEINYSNFRGMLKGRRAVPDWALKTLSEIAANKTPPSPPIHGNKDGRYGVTKKISPYISDLVSRFCKVGWRRDEIVIGLINWAANDVRKNHGKIAVEDLLKTALSAVNKQ